MNLLHYFLTAALPLTEAWTAGSRFSSFTASTASAVISKKKSHRFHSNDMLMYDSSRDPPNNKNDNVFSVLADTERWISETLAGANTGTANNPYTRKEVTYVCESNSEAALVVAGIFRRLREARELGESHGSTEEERRDEVGMLSRS